MFRVVTPLIGAIVLGLAISSPLVAEEVKQPVFSQDRNSVKSRLENVRRLVNTSSGALRVQQAGGKAESMRQGAAEHLEKAETAFAAGDMAAASGELQTATIAMFQAIRTVGSGPIGEEKLQEDYRDKRNSLAALLEALERIAQEKGTTPTAAHSIRSQVAAADQLAAAGGIKQARVKLDKAYDAVKAEIEKLRSGDTLVRSLNFASKEEEYTYELDRNATHQMLVKLLLDDKKLDSGTQAQVDLFIAEAGGMRKQAEAAASTGDFGRGVTLLEESTRALVRAIRRAGVYIPG